MEHSLRLNDVRAVILAGGTGTRLWPLSRKEHPKQFSRLVGEGTLFEAAIQRVSGLVDPKEVLVITSRSLATGEAFQLLKKHDLLLEPVARGTAAAIGLAAMRYRIENIDPVLVVMPSDHLIGNVGAFRADLRACIEAAMQGKLVLLGIKPARPETGFGYIQFGAGSGIRSVTSFHEKPGPEIAARMVASGQYAWNSGIFIWRASTILAEIETHLPELARSLDAIAILAKSSGDLQSAIDARFHGAPTGSIDAAVLERTNKLFMLPATFDWSDVGNWDAVYEAAEKDSALNHFEGNTVALECRNTFIRSDHRVVAALGLHDVTIVETRDAVLVSRRGMGQQVVKVVEVLTDRAAPQLASHATIRRPWGSYTVIDEGPGFKTKRIDVRPGARLSLQRHKHRSEHWVVVSGEATVTCEGQVRLLHANESTYIPAGSLHRLENAGSASLEIVEVQVGSYIGEDDIERFDDHYGRRT
jgi:mannose-1-phosphate guanylyltransferase/mannose-6-phosphate isomerase